MTIGLATVAAALTWAGAMSELSHPHDVDWATIAVVSAVLLVCEAVPATWIRFGPIGVVTTIWLFAYAIVLLGSPTMAIGVALVGTVIRGVLRSEAVDAIVRSMAGTAISLATAGLVLSAAGVRGPITQFDRLPWDWAVAIVLTGFTILVLNALVSSMSASLRRRISFVALLRRGLAVRVTAEGALLSLAPIWVIGLDSSLVLVPLLGITSVLVFRSTRQALERYHEANHDQLTGLLNRRGLLAQIDDSLTDARPTIRSTILIMDLNGFKEVNDRLGHQIGDALLVQFAERLERSRPEDAVAARLGGDEFALLIVSNAADDALFEMVNELHRRLAAPLSVEGFPVAVGVSVGLATSPDDGRTRRDLLRGADVAMYKAKRTGTSVECYANCVKGPQRGRLNLLTDLPDALANHQLHIQFQPQIRVADGAVDTVEALIRWQHPDYGPIPPSEFIGLAEQTELIGPITEMVLRGATSSLLTIKQTDVRLAVNVSARNIQDRYFANGVLAILADVGFPPDRLELEVTERAIVSHPERSTYTIDRLREAGVRIAIDDFGVGYASYQVLRLLDVDRVKVDRELVQGLLNQRRDLVIVSSLIQLAHDLELDVVAEGVEGTVVWNALAELGCDLAQGFGIAVPMGLADLRDWLAEWDDVIKGRSFERARGHAQV